MSIKITTDKETRLRKRMSALGIKEDDILEKFTKSRGPGGQRVNKSSTCVYLRHLPTGIEVKCQRERSQALNRYIAKNILLDKIESYLKKTEEDKRYLFEKIRRKRRTRSSKSKVILRHQKKKRSEIKKLRGRFSYEDFL